MVHVNLPPNEAGFPSTASDGADGNNNMVVHHYHGSVLSQSSMFDFIDKVRASDPPHYYYFSSTNDATTVSPTYTTTYTLLSRHFAPR